MKVHTEPATDGRSHSAASVGGSGKVRARLFACAVVVLSLAIGVAAAQPAPDLQSARNFDPAFAE